LKKVDFLLEEFDTIFRGEAGDILNLR